MPPHDPAAARSTSQGPDAPGAALEEAERVLDVARDPALPLDARAAALARVSALLDLECARRPARGSLAEVAGQVRAHALAEAQHGCWAELAPALAAAGAPVPAPAAAAATAGARAAFRRDVFPALTPLALGPAHPKPRVASGAIEVAALVEPSGRRRARRLALVPIPAGLPRLVELAGSAAPVLVEDLVAAHVAELFPGNAVAAAAPFRATVAAPPEGRIARRARAAEVARLEIRADAPEPLVAALVLALRVAPAAVFFARVPLRLHDLAGPAPRVGGAGRLAG